MVATLTRNWWMWLIRGIAAVIFGLLAFLWPGATIVVIGILFGAYALVDGIFAIVATIRAAETQQRWWPFLIEGIVGILIAAITFYDIGITLLALYLTIAAWAFLTGIFEIIAALQLRKHIANEIWLIIGGVASIAFGILMVYFPLAGALAIIWLIAAYAVIFGLLMIGFALRLRAHVPAMPIATAG
ncbi:MAG: HdeD family acid-resistance protein [Candidatus Eremiobacteraeota bacterium]|nr:HdeD family acid-resistance protein [Candidatus Eremiobacteraeota bacterium]